MGVVSIDVAWQSPFWVIVLGPLPGPPAARCNDRLRCVRCAGLACSFSGPSPPCRALCVLLECHWNCNPTRKQGSTLCLKALNGWKNGPQGIPALACPKRLSTSTAVRVRMCEAKRIVPNICSTYWCASSWIEFVSAQPNGSNKFSGFTSLCGPRPFWCNEGGATKHKLPYN